MAIRPNDRFTAWYFRAVIAIFVSLWLYLLAAPDGRVPLGNGAIETWQLHRDATGRVHFLGIAVAEARLVDVSNRLQLAPDVGLMTSRLAGHTRRQIEAHYSDIEGGDLILTLESPPNLVEKISAARFNPYRYDSGTERLGIPSPLLHDVGKLTVNGVTYVADQQYAIEALRSRFGPPQPYSHNETNERHYLFPDYGMDVTSVPGASTVVQIVDPRDIERLTAPLTSVATSQ